MAHAHTLKRIPINEDASCGGACAGAPLSFSFRYAYQPIVNVQTRQIYAHEALIRGPDGESAQHVLSQVNDANRYQFDQACRVQAIKTAAELNMQTRLSINFLPNAIYKPEVCIRSTLEAAQRYNFPMDRIIFESVEGEQVNDGKWLAEVMNEYKRIGFLTAIDDFGAGFAGLNLLADFQPDILKLDMGLVRDIDRQPVRQSIVRNIARICEELSICIVAEGVETIEESACLQDIGIARMQGYLYSKPLLQRCGQPENIDWPAQR